VILAKCPELPVVAKIDGPFINLNFLVARVGICPAHFAVFGQWAGATYLLCPPTSIGRSFGQISYWQFLGSFFVNLTGDFLFFFIYSTFRESNYRHYIIIFILDDKK